MQDPQGPTETDHIIQHEVEIMNTRLEAQWQAEFQDLVLNVERNLALQREIQAILESRVAQYDTSSRDDDDW